MVKPPGESDQGQAPASCYMLLQNGAVLPETPSAAAAPDGCPLLRDMVGHVPASCV